MFGQAFAFVQASAGRRAHSAGMKTRKVLVLIVPAALLLGVAAFLQTATSAAEGRQAPRFDWLSGQWCGESDGESLEEFWLPSKGNLALGVGRTIKGGITTSHEFLRIQTRDGATRLTALHNGQSPTAFALTASGADWARFENPEHDFPKRIEYRRVATGLHAEIAGPGDDGKETVIPFEFRRCVD